MASLGWVTPGAATEGVTPLFCPQKPGDLFSHHRVLRCHLCLFSPEKWRHFCSSLSLFYWFHSGVTPLLEGVTPHLFTCPTSFLHNCKFAHKKIFLRVSPPGECHRGRSAPPQWRHCLEVFFYSGHYKKFLMGSFWTVSRDFHIHKAAAYHAGQCLIHSTSHFCLSQHKYELRHYVKQIRKFVELK